MPLQGNQTHQPMRFIASIIHLVENLTAASDFLCNTLEFQKTDSSEDFHLLENGSVSLRLVKNKDMPPSILNLEMPTKTLEQDTQELLKINGIELIAENVSISPYRLETRLKAPHNIIITLSRSFNEDDLDIMPPLPISLDWDGETMETIQQLLKQVPIEFRERARTKTTERAETLAAEHGLITVEENHALMALADFTPPFQQQALSDAMRERGIDPEPYFPEEKPQ